MFEIILIGLVCFNSTLVQLKASHTAVVLYLNMCFNSTLVQLKVWVIPHVLLI